MEKKIIGLALFILSVHVFALVYKLYYFIRWLDIPMHFMGGFLAALVFFWFFKKYPSFFNPQNNFLITLILVSGWVALIGVLWEFAEFLHAVLISSDKLIEPQAMWLFDTLKDLFFDLFGGFSLSAIINFHFNKKNIQKVEH
jgi:hypothetical protein